jgi:uncharacterized surface protein with fasciclin (FAS1) repeats
VLQGLPGAESLLAAAVQAEKAPPGELFTLFAPTDAAFIEAVQLLPDATIDQLLEVCCPSTIALKFNMSQRTNTGCRLRSRIQHAPGWLPPLTPLSKAASPSPIGTEYIRIYLTLFGGSGTSCVQHTPTRLLCALCGRGV